MRHKDSLSPNTMYTMRWWGTRTVCHQTPCILCVDEAQGQSVTKHHVQYALMRHKDSLSPYTMYTMRWWGTRTVCHQTPCTLCADEAQGKFQPWKHKRRKLDENNKQQTNKHQNKWRHLLLLLLLLFFPINTRHKPSELVIASVRQNLSSCLFVRTCHRVCSVNKNHDTYRTAHAQKQIQTDILWN